MQALALADNEVEADNLDEHPEAGDPRWEEWSKLLLARLDKPQNLTWLQAWASTNSDWDFTRQCLAWLSVHDRVKIVTFRGSLCWVNVNWVLVVADASRPAKIQIKKKLSREKIRQQLHCWDTTLAFASILQSIKRLTGTKISVIANVLGIKASTVFHWTRGYRVPSDEIILPLLPKLKVLLEAPNAL